MQDKIKESKQRDNSGRYIKTGQYNICIICNNKFYVKKCEQKRVFCSHKCYSINSVGRKLKQETIDKIIKSREGYKHSNKTKEKIGKGNAGKKNHFWKGGISVGKNKKEYQKHARRLRKARIKKAKGKYSLKEWLLLLKKFNLTCPCCGKAEPEISLVADHIIPISKGGNNNIKNIQPLCFHCNSVKYTKTKLYKPWNVLDS